MNHSVLSQEDEVLAGSAAVGAALGRRGRLGKGVAAVAAAPDQLQAAPAADHRLDFGGWRDPQEAAVGWDEAEQPSVLANDKRGSDRGTAACRGRTLYRVVREGEDEGTGQGPFGQGGGGGGG